MPVFALVGFIFLYCFDMCAFLTGFNNCSCEMLIDDKHKHYVEYYIISTSTMLNIT